MQEIIKVDISKLKFDNDINSLVPEMTEEEFNDLVKKIDEEGQRTPIHINKDNTILDGRHRVEALRELGIPVIEATIHEGLTVEEEAEMYYGINDRPAKSPNSKGKSSLKFGDQSAVEIEEAVQSVGLQIDYDKKGNKDGYITAYAALQNIHKKYGKEFLKVVLETIKQSFGLERRFYQAFIIKGFAGFISMYGNKIDVTHLINRLQEIGYEGFIQEANKKQVGFKTKKESLPLALAEIYNKRKHNKNKLDTRLLFI